MLLSSNWDVEGDQDISKLIEEYSSAISDEVAELLKEENCFILHRKSNQNCCLHITCPDLLNKSSSHCVSGKSIEKLTILSEAKIIEVYVGLYDEYLGSFTSDVIDQFGDASMCRTDITFSKPYSSVKLSLKSTFEESSIMVFGVFSKVKYIDVKNQINASRFTSGHLESLLKDHQINFSKDALSFKDALQSYNDNSKQPSHDSNLALSVMPFLSNMNPSALQNAFQKKKNSDNADSGSNSKTENIKSNALTATGLNIPSVMENLKKSTLSEIKSDKELQNIPGIDEKALTRILNDTIDKKFEEIEKRLMNFVDEKLSKQTELLMRKLNVSDKEIC